MKKAVKKSRVAVPRGRSQAMRGRRRRHDNGNLATGKRTDNDPAPRSRPGLNAQTSVIEPNERPTDIPVVEDPFRSDESGETPGVSERFLASTPGRTQLDEVIVRQDVTSGNVTLASDVSDEKAARGGFRKRLQLLAPHFRRVLYKTASGSPLVSGTTVPEANVAELVRMLRERSAQPSGKGAKLAGRLLQQLKLERAPGPVTVEGVKVEQLKKLLDMLREVEAPEAAGGAITRKPNS